MPRSPFLVGLVVIAVAAGPLVGQDIERPLSAEVRLEDFGVGRADFILRGQLSVAYTSKGPKLSVAFLRDVPPAVLGPSTEARPPAPGPSGGAAAAPARARALWVWSTRELLADDTARSAFLDFVARRRITRVYLALPPAKGRAPDAGFVPFDGAALAPLIVALRKGGAEVDALDGDPAYALGPNHEGVLRTVARVVDYNRSAEPAARFHGVHYDIEPYLLPGFQGPAREDILESYLELLDGLAREAHRGDLAVGVDVPFWLDAPFGETGRPLEAVHRGVQRTVLEQILSMVDEVTVMDYRTAALGPDGAVAHAVGEITAASGSGVKVWVGLETGPIADEDVVTFGPEPAAGGPRQTGGASVAVEVLGQGRVRVWLVPAGGGATLSADLEREGRDAASLLYWPVRAVTRVPGTKLSFHDLDASHLESAADTLAAHLRSLPAFAGLAYHDYASLRKLLAGR
jgi:hypothetical protein